MKKLFIFCIPIFAYSFSNAQFGTDPSSPRVDITNLIPKSPQADQLVRVNELNLNGASGTPNISFNLYTCTVGNLKIPITITYDASGIKYDDIPSSVGLKWTLRAGGEVSRSINGLPDESYYFDMDNTVSYSEDYMTGLNTGTSGVQDFLTDVANNHADISQDQYSYNFLDKSGYFYYHKKKFYDGTAPFTLKIVPDSFKLLHQFTITDDMGNISTFGSGGIIESTAMTLGGSGYITPNYPTQGNTSWKITNLSTYTNQKATFEYDTTYFEVDRLLSQSYSYRQPVDLGGSSNSTCNCGNSSFNEATSATSYGVFLISKIHTPNEDVQFYYSRNNSLSIYKKKLDSIVVKNKIDSSVVKRFHFHYDTYTTANLLRLHDVYTIGNLNDSLLVASFHYNSSSLPGVTTLNRDIFNYYNGASNSYLLSNSDADCPSPLNSAGRAIDASTVKIGVLDTLYYPTGGKASFAYSSNTEAPGIKVDSICYFNTDNSVTTKFKYSYSGQSGESFGLSGGYVNNSVYNSDNFDCPVKTFNSEIPVYPPVVPVYYDTIEIRKISPTSNQTELTKEVYTAFLDVYSTARPFIAERIYFRGNSLTDTLKIETYNYADSTLDSMSHDWLYPSPGYLAPPTYYLDGNAYNNGDCHVLYYGGAGEYGVMNPRKNLLTSIAVKDFDQSTSTLALTDTHNNTYNPYWQIIGDWKITSKGTLDSTVFNYLYSNGDALTSSVKSNNLYSLVDKVTRFTNSGVQLDRSRGHFATQSNGFILPDSTFIQTLTNAEVWDKMITAYDTLGQVTEVNSKYGFYTSLLRNYNNQLLVAEVTGSKLTQCAYTSFEAESKGGWSYSGGASSDATSPTGGKCYNLSGGDITKSSLPSMTYIVSLWTNSHTFSINGSSTQTRTGKTINGWTYYEFEVSGTSITITGSAYVDELRLYPKGAQMLTYTYQPLVGLSAQCDADNRITYYEYDSQGRLKNIKDQDKNILKSYDYQYQVSQSQ